ncbi:MAG: histidine kinase [Thainema sp.]
MSNSPTACSLPTQDAKTTTTPCHIVVDGNPAIMYASRNGTPAKIIRLLNRFLETFAQERETSGEYCDTPECLLAQVLVRFGFEFCEDDFSNLKVGLTYYSNAAYLYQIRPDFSVRVWQPTEAYRQNPDLGLEACMDITDQY